MLKYSIKDLEQITGIKAHTLRVWEQRYGLFSPNRSETNIRRYSNEDLRMLLNISILNANGMKISRIAELRPEEMRSEVLAISNRNLEENLQIDNLVLAMVEMDEDRFEKAISNNILKKGFDFTIRNIIYPFLVKVGVLWITESINPAQEHFISNLVRQKLFTAIDGQVPKYGNHTESYLLFLPDQELHEISLLYYHFLLRQSGQKSIFLGQAVPFEDLEKVFGIHRPKNLLTVLTSPLPGDGLQAYLNRLAATFPDSRILVSGYQLVHLKPILTPNVVQFNTPADLVDLMPSLEGGS